MAMITRRGLLEIAGAATFSSLALAEQPVRIVVPFGPGAVADTLARAVSQELSDQLRVPVVVENRAGAGGTIGTAFVAKAPPDGQTLILAAASHTLAAHLYSKLSYDPIRDFTPIAHIGNFGYVIAAPANMGVTDFDGWLRLVKSRPGQFNYASAGNGSASHLGMAYLLSRFGAQLEHIPMKSTGDAVTELLAGRAHAIMSAQTGLVGFKGDSRLVFLAYTGSSRSKALPELPTVTEATHREFVFESWNGVLAPAGLTQADVERLSASMYKVLAQPAVQDRLARLGIESSPLALADFRTLLKRDWDNAGAIVKASGARVE